MIRAKTPNATIIVDHSNDTNLSWKTRDLTQDEISKTREENERACARTHTDRENILGIHNKRCLSNTVTGSQNKLNAEDSQENYTWLMTIEHDHITWKANGLFELSTWKKRIWLHKIFKSWKEWKWSGESIIQLTDFTPQPLTHPSPIPTPTPKKRTF